LFLNGLRLITSRASTDNNDPKVATPIFTASNFQAQARLAGMILFGLCTLSLSAHKELRFAFPFLPPAIAIGALGFDHIQHFLVKREKKALSFAVVVLVAVLGAIPALYLGLVHQRAAIDVSFYLSSMVSSSVKTIDVLLPCHAMPSYSMLHPIKTKHVTMTFLDCSPHLEELRYVLHLNTSFGPQIGVNETFQFLADPYRFTLDRYEETLPNVIVTGSKYQRDIERALKERKVGTQLRTCARFKQAQNDVGGELMVLCDGKQ
jgi:hypothetical protein